MPKYDVALRPVPPHATLLPLLERFGAWVGRREHGSLGWFDGLGTEAIPEAHFPAHIEKLRAAGYVFLTLPDGSALALVSPTPDDPPAVVLFGSEGASAAIASSFEELLVAWSRGETGVMELDEIDEGRAPLARWLRKEKIRVPERPLFDLHAWLDGERPAELDPLPSVDRRTPTATYHALPASLRPWIDLLGAAADDPALIDAITKLKRKVPAVLSKDEYTWVSVPRRGPELLFERSVLSEASALRPKSRKSFVPYFSGIELDAKACPDILGVSWDEKALEAIEAVLGEPAERRSEWSRWTSWELPLDERGEILLHVRFRRRMEANIRVASGRSLDDAPSVSTHVFVAWALTRGLVDEARFSAHRALVDAVKRREARASALVQVALERGLWDTHLRRAPGLRPFAHGWFHNLGGSWIVGDFKEIFGARPGPHGHPEPDLDEDTWEAVDAATATLDARFAAWLGTS